MARRELTQAVGAGEGDTIESRFCLSFGLSATFSPLGYRSQWDTRCTQTGADGRRLRLRSDPEVGGRFGQGGGVTFADGSHDLAEEGFDLLRGAADEAGGIRCGLDVDP